jgi:hypothetical protein
MHTLRPGPWLLGLAFLCCAVAFADDAPPLQADLEDHAVAEGWIYDDIEAGYDEARRTGKPLLIVFR